MSLNRKVEAYTLLKDGETYRIVNLHYDNNSESDKVIVEQKIKQIKKSKEKEKTKVIKKNVITDFQKLFDFIKLNNNLKFRGNKNDNLFYINSFEFKNVHNICKILFYDGKKMENIELIKLQKIYKVFNKKQLKKLSENVKKMLSQ